MGRERSSERERNTMEETSSINRALARRTSGSSAILVAAPDSVGG